MVSYAALGAIIRHKPSASANLISAHPCPAGPSKFPPSPLFHFIARSSLFSPSPLRDQFSGCDGGLGESHTTLV